MPYDRLAIPTPMRWAAWLARGAARDRAARRRFMTIAPTAVAMALTVYLWFLR